jgi:hypothetical protein
MEKRQKEREQRLLGDQTKFDSSAVGMALIQLGAFFHDIVSPVDF